MKNATLVLQFVFGTLFFHATYQTQIYEYMQSLICHYFVLQYATKLPLHLSNFLQNRMFQSETPHYLLIANTAAFFFFRKGTKETSRSYWIFLDFKKQYFTFQRWKHLPGVWCLWGTGRLSVGTMLNFGSSDCFFCQSSYFSSVCLCERARDLKQIMFPLFRLKRKPSRQLCQNLGRKTILQVIMFHNRRCPYIIASMGDTGRKSLSSLVSTPEKIPEFFWAYRTHPYD